jgi:hypothetical protein
LPALRAPREARVSGAPILSPATIRPSSASRAAAGNLDGVSREQVAADALRDKLQPVRERNGDRVADLLFDLVYFHARERKPAWWSVFDKMGAEAEVLIEDLECLGGLVAKSSPVDGGKSWERAYEFPEQETKLEPGACHVDLDGLPVGVTLMEIDRANKQGKRVAVVSNSHKAVDNLLCAVIDRAVEAGRNVKVAKKGGGEFAGIYNDRIYQTERNKDAQLFTASSWVERLGCFLARISTRASTTCL